jgi:energy-coupling factor transporter ATP-binding protein EcfA2
MSKKKTVIKGFKFKKHENIGAMDAADDATYLFDCFVDTGELGILRDVSDPRCIILGRTGSGKTALLQMLSSVEDRVIQISPDSLALAYLSNNSVLQFFMEVGVDMDLFFRVLWRHIFALEITRAHLDLTSQAKAQDFILKWKNRIFPQKAREVARDYLVNYGETFWKTTDYRVKEYTKTLEEKLEAATSATLSSSVPGFASGEVKIAPHLAKSLTEAQKIEIAQHGQPVVEESQIREMALVFDMLNEELSTNMQRKYFIVIDHLDEPWVKNELRYRLIRALIQTVRDINRDLAVVKIVVAIREDLLSRVFRYTRNTGDQEEKYRSLYLRLNWQIKDLETLLDSRVNRYIRRQYTTEPVKARELLPDNIDK